MSLGLLMAGHADPFALADMAVQAEGLGFSDVWIADERFYREVYSLLSVIAMKTERIQLGPCVTDPFSRHPALTAMAITTLDDISRGRAILGLGAGISGFAEMEMPRPKPIRAIRESAELIRAMCSGEEVTYRGEVVVLNGGKLGYKPRRAALPLWIASNGPMGQEMSARIANAVIMEACGNTSEAESFRRRIDKAAEAAGRAKGSVKCIARLNLSISDDRAEAFEALRLRAARTLAAGRTHFDTLESQGLTLSEAVRARVADVPYKAGGAPYELIRHEVSDAIVAAVALAGTGADIQAQLGALFAAGIDGVIVAALPAKGMDAAATLEKFVNEAWRPAWSAAGRAPLETVAA